jgi:hypothetical protein
MGYVTRQWRRSSELLLSQESCSVHRPTIRPPPIDQMTQAAGSPGPVAVSCAAMEIAALTVSILALIISIPAAVAAVASARASKQSATAAATAASIELDRRHNERCPRLKIACSPINPQSDLTSDQLRLTVALVGPPELDRLDQMTVTIRDDRPGRGDGAQRPGGPSPDEVRAQVWSPYRFVPGTGPGADPSRGVPGADSTGRTTPTSGVLVGDALLFVLEPTLPPRWSNQTTDDWRREQGAVLKLAVECHDSGDRPWTITAEIDTRDPDPVEVPATGS